MGHLQFFLKIRKNSQSSQQDFRLAQSCVVNGQAIEAIYLQIIQVLC